MPDTLRFIDTAGLKSLKDGEVGPWRIGDDLLLRTHQCCEPLVSLEEAQSVFDKYQVAYEQGVGTPKPYEVVKVPSGYGVLVEYIRGLSIVVHIAIGSVTSEEAGLEMGKLARRLHAVQSSSGIDWKRRFCLYAKRLAGVLPPEDGEKFVSLVRAIPETQALLHGDLHLGNVVLHHGSPRFIDLECAGFGHPVFDLSILYSRMLFSGIREGMRAGFSRERCEKVSNDMWRGMLRGYFPDATEEELERISMQVMLLAEAEDCSFAHNIGGDASQLSEAQQSRIALVQERFAEYLPKVSRLDF